MGRPCHSFARTRSAGRPRRTKEHPYKPMRAVLPVRSAICLARGSFAACCGSSSQRTLPWVADSEI